MARALAFLDPGDGDAFRAGLVAAGRIPVVTHTVMRMHSPASIPGPGNAGSPSDPGPPPAGPGLPVCPVTDPACTTTPGSPAPEPQPEPDCNPLTDPGCKQIPPSCQAPPGWLDGLLAPDTAP